MGTVALQIQSPVHQATFVGAAANAINLQGMLPQPAPVPLFYKWYSSLHTPTGITSPADAPKAALNWPNHSQLTLTVALAVGSHTITLAAKDREGESLADVQAVQHAGFAGGPVDAEQPCIIHVFKANIIQPAGAPSPLPLNKGNSTLMAQAPLKWGKQNEQGVIVRDEDYHAINRIRYRWRFEPAGGGAPLAGLPALGADENAIAAFQQSLHFHPADEDHPAPFVSYQGALPAALQPNTNYRLVLRVEDIQSPHIGEEASILIRVVA